MKPKLFIPLLFLALSPVPCALSQTPQGFNYQAIARDATGTSIANQSLPVMITIQSDSLGTGVIWRELHSSVTSNQLGLINLVLGKGARQGASTVATFSDIDWSVTPKFIKTEVYYGGSYKTMGVSRLWAVPYSLVAEDLAGSVKRLTVTGDTENMDEALFEVKNRTGQTIFAVYNEGVRVYVSDGDAKGLKGGFAVGGFGTDKAESTKYMFVGKDSVRIYLDTNPLTKKLKGGFAVGGYDLTKGTVQNYLDVSADSVRIYIDSNPEEKKQKGGFAVGGYDLTKGITGDYFNVSGKSDAEIINGEARVVWYPAKEAFLAGNVLIESKDSVGLNSWASGYRSKAIGNWSQALGYNAIARGDYSTAIGKNAVVDDINSFAFGDSTIARGEASYALGKKATATGYGSFAIGSIGIDSLGNKIGTNTRSAGIYSFAIGLGAVSDHQGAFAIGTSALSTGDFSLAMGYNTEASGKFATSLGIGSDASGDRSFATGSSTASGFNSTALGNSKASGRNSFSVGTYIVKNLLDPTLTTHASADYSSAIGVGTAAYSFCMTAVGSYNETGSGSLNAWVDTEPIFVVGNGKRSVGTMVSRSTALTILKNGNVGIGTVNPQYLLDINGSARVEGGLATGDQTKAIAPSSATFGIQTVASGIASVAMGESTKANSRTSLVVGRYNDTTTTMYNSIVHWYPADPLFICGNGSDDSNRANAFTVYKNGNSYIQGRLGIGTTNPQYPLDINGEGRVSGSLAIGSGSIASGTNSLAAGSNTLASSLNSTALGYFTTAGGLHSAAFGFYTVAIGSKSMATGDETKATGASSVSFGTQTVSSGSSSVSMGQSTKAKTIASLVIGRYNDTTSVSPDSYRVWDPADPLFICGNGTADNSRTNAFTIYKNGNTYIQGSLGIGTSDPSATLTVSGSAEIGGSNPTATNGNATLYLHHYNNIAHQLRYSSGTLYLEAAGNGYGTSTTPNFVIGGSVGVGIDAPDSKLHVNGAGPNGISVSGSCSGGSTSVVAVWGTATGAGTGPAKGVVGKVNRNGTGTYHSGYFYSSGTGGSYAGLYADYRTGASTDIAEYILDTENNTLPGDVVIADPNNTESILKSSIPFDERVVGVISTKPHLIMGIELIRDEETGKEYENVHAAKLALAGRVPVKVTDENGSIKIGDFITTSSKPGYGMKWSMLDVTQANDFEELKTIISENEKRRGAIIGKALETHKSGDGLIIVLIGT